jgi:hypothetical protein
MSEATTTEAPPPNPDASGLLDNANPVDPKVTQTEAAESVPHREGEPTPKPAPAKVERPAYVPEKFWDKDKGELLTEAAMKAYGDLEKKFKDGRHKPPTDGKYDLAAFNGKQPEDDPLMQVYVEWAGRHGLSQAAFDELAQKVVAMGNDATAQLQLSRKAEMEKLGERAPQIIDGMVDWARGLLRSGAWSVEDFEEFKIWGGTAAGLRALMKVREVYEGRVPLAETLPKGEGAVSRDELRDMIGDPRYKTNEGGFRDKVTRLYNQHYGNGAAP